MSDLIRVAKDGAHMSVHPSCLDAHKSAGWAIAGDQSPAATDLGLEEPGAADRDELAGKTVAELKALAAERGVDLGDSTKKADIIAALELAAEEAADA
jgi:hypothetical protein